MELGKCTTNFVVTNIPCCVQAGKASKESVSELPLEGISCGDAIEYFKSLAKIGKEEGCDSLNYSISRLRIKQEDPATHEIEESFYFSSGEKRVESVSSLFAAAVVELHQTWHRRECEERAAIPAKSVATQTGEQVANCS